MHPLFDVVHRVVYANVVLAAALICSFDIILVDPPRAGLDKDTRRMVAQYAYIVYISCSPKSLQRDLLEV